MVTGRKGGVFFGVEIEGKAAHSGANFAEGISAISELAHKVVALDALTDLDKGVTVNVGLVSGGLSVNTSAPSAKAAIDLRIFDLDQRESLVGRIRCICDKSFIQGTRSTLNITGEFRPSFPRRSRSNCSSCTRPSWACWATRPRASSAAAARTRA